MLPLEKILIGVIGALVSGGFTFLIKMYFTSLKEARDGRKVLHEKIEELQKLTSGKCLEYEKDIGKLVKTVTQLESFHRINHPGQLK